MVRNIKNTRIPTMQFSEKKLLQGCNKKFCDCII